MPLSRRSDRSSRHSLSRPDKKAPRPNPASVPQVVNKLVKPLVEYESNESSLSSNNSPVHYKEDKQSSTKSSSSRSRVIESAKKSNKVRSASRNKKHTGKHHSSSSKTNSTSSSKQRREYLSSPKSKKRKSKTKTRSYRRSSSSSDESMDSRRVHPYEYGQGSYPPRSPNSFKSNYPPPPVGPRDTWEQPPPYDRLRSPPHTYPPRPQSPGYSHPGARRVIPVIRRSPSHSPHFHGNRSPRQSDYPDSGRFMDRDGRQFAPRSPGQSPSYNQGNAHSPHNSGFVFFYNTKFYCGNIILLKYCLVTPHVI